jgi:hypothetical protein
MQLGLHMPCAKIYFARFLMSFDISSSTKLNAHQLSQVGHFHYIFFGQVTLKSGYLFLFGAEGNLFTREVRLRRRKMEGRNICFETFQVVKI